MAFILYKNVTLRKINDFQKLLLNKNNTELRKGSLKFKKKV